MQLIPSLPYDWCNFGTLELAAPDALLITYLLLLNTTGLYLLGTYKRSCSTTVRYVPAFGAFLVMVGCVFNIGRCLFDDVWLILPISYTEVIWQTVVLGSVIYNKGNMAPMFPYRSKSNDK